jgi:hypothetical protein
MSEEEKNQSLFWTSDGAAGWVAKQESTGERVGMRLGLPGVWPYCIDRFSPAFTQGRGNLLFELNLHLHKSFN